MVVSLKKLGAGTRPWEVIWAHQNQDQVPTNYFPYKTKRMKKYLTLWRKLSCSHWTGLIPMLFLMAGVRYRFIMVYFQQICAIDK